MKVHNAPQDRPLTPQLTTALAEMRAERAFDPALYTAAKVHLIRTYWHASSLTAAIVSVSGGLDSAVVAALMARAADRGYDPGVARTTAPPALGRVVAVLQPVHASGATRQDDATALGTEACAAAGLTPHVVELAPVHALVASTVEAATGLAADDWARGQLVAYVRVPVLAYTASLLTAAGEGACIAGTTNRDEGAYLGYVGKFSDGMVDVQVISDLHKSEVRALAAHLGVPQGILDATPSGDMYDGRSDTEVFGASYDVVELYLGLKQRLGGRRVPETIPDVLDDSGLTALRHPDAESVAQVRALGKNLEALHDYNAHKYVVGSPAVHLDILQSAVGGGWDGPQHWPMTAGEWWEERRTPLGRAMARALQDVAALLRRHDRRLGLDWYRPVSSGVISQGPTPPQEPDDRPF